MPQSLANILVHLIFSTKERRPLLQDDVRPKLHAYIIGILENHGSPSLATNSMTDHIHILFSLSRTITIAKIVEEVKTGSSVWLKTQSDGYRDFHWQNGYGAFSIGQSQVEDMKKYVASQQEHHRKVSFQDEHRKFLEKYQVEYDERYVWD
jgi:putative transposase